MPRRGSLLLLFALFSLVPNLAWCDVSQWTELGPPLLQGSAVFDPVSKRLFVLGSSDPRVWVLDQSSPAQSSQWSVLTVIGTPPPSRTSGYVFLDPIRNRLILYGDSDHPALHDVWSLSLSGVPQWTAVSMLGAPPDRQNPGVLFDPLTNRLVLFGGRNPQSTSALSFHNDVWVGDLGSSGPWQSVAPSGTPPSARASVLPVLDSRRHRMVFFGGGGPDTSSNIVTWRDLWALSLDSLATWSMIPADGMTAEFSGGIVQAVYDSTGDRMIVTGIEQYSINGPEIIPAKRSEIWAVSLSDASPVWQTLFSSGIGNGSEFARQDALLTVDDPGRRLLLVGGNRSQWTSSSAAWTENRADTWQFGLDSHSPNIVPGAGEIPPPRKEASLTFDPVSHQFFLFGGVRGGGVYLSDLWTISDSSGAGWRGDANGPAARWGHSAVYDPLLHRILIFGGAQGLGTLFNDVWALTPGSPSTWQLVATTGTPPSARYGQAAVFDPVGNRMIVFGGHNASGDLNDTWILTFSGMPLWTKISGPAPPAMSFAGAVLDPTRSRMVVFSGKGIWALDLTSSPAWSEWNSASPFGYNRADYDQATDNALLYAQGSETLPSSSITAIRLDGTLATKTLNPPGSTYRTDHVQALDPGRRILVAGLGLQGGSLNYPLYLQDMRMISLGDPSVPALASLVSASADSGAVTVTWLITGARTAVTVERRDAHNPWAERAMVTPDASGRITLRDDQVAPGATYDYRLGFGNGLYAGFVEVAVAGSAPRFALLGTYPNPSPSPLTVSFQLPDATPAELQLVDVRGKVIASREVGALGAGIHSVRLVPTAGMGAGVYFAVLRRAHETLEHRVVLLGKP